MCQDGYICDKLSKTCRLPTLNEVCQGPITAVSSTIKITGASYCVNNSTIVQQLPWDILKSVCDNKSECITNVPPVDESCIYDNRNFYYSWNCVTSKNVVVDGGSAFIPSVADNKGISITCPIIYSNDYANESAGCKHGLHCMNILDEIGILHVSVENGKWPAAYPTNSFRYMNLATSGIMCSCTPPPIPYFIGCFNDSQERALPYFAGQKSLTKDCIDACRNSGYHFAGRQAYGECWCGGANSEGLADYDEMNYAKYGPSNECKCIFDQNIGFWVNCVYKVPPTTPEYNNNHFTCADKYSGWCKASDDCLSSFYKGSWDNGCGVKEESKLFVPIVRPDININYDLKSAYPIENVYIQFWDYTTIKSIQIGLYMDDEYTGQQPDNQGIFHLPYIGDPAWKWYTGTPVTSGEDVEQVISLPGTGARYVQIQLRGGNSSLPNHLRWGVHKVELTSLTGTCTMPSINQECVPSIGCLDGYLCKLVNSNIASYVCMVSNPCDFFADVTI